MHWGVEYESLASPRQRQLARRMIDALAEAHPDDESWQALRSAWYEEIANSALVNYVTASRLLYGMARDGRLPGPLSKVHATRRTPHVAIGVLWLASLLIYSFNGKFDAKRALDVEIAGLYWHFVDIVWIVIFTVVYLLEILQNAGVPKA